MVSPLIQINKGGGNQVYKCQQKAGKKNGLIEKAAGIL
jgi:hypothetical protein